MAKLPRVFQRIFGSGAGTDQISQFGSLAAGSPVFTTDPDTAQNLSNWLTGWFGAVIDGNAPAIEDMNSVLFVYAYQLAYLMQAGIAEWNASTVYYIGSLVNSSGTIYSSLTDGNTNHAVSDPANWKKIGGDIMSAIGDTIYGGVAGAQTKLGGNTSVIKNFLTQTGTGTASAAPAWAALAAPNVVEFTANGTYTPSAGCLYALVKMVGGGGGGSGAGTSGAGNGGSGGNTTVGSLLLAGGGGGGSYNNNVGAGGGCSITAPAYGFYKTGGGGSGGTITPASGGNCGGGNGGATPFGTGGGSFGVNNNPSPANSGAGGTGSGGSGVSSVSGNGGGGGGYIEAIIPAPSGTYAVVIGGSGSAGAGGAGGNGGVQGATGYVVIYEFFQ